MEGETNSIKYLAIHLDKRLAFTKHCTEISRKAYAAMRYIYPYIHFTNPLNRTLQLQLYKAFVRSTIIYAAPVWSSTAESNLIKLQTIENKSLKIMLGKKPFKISNEKLYAEHQHELLKTIIREKATKLFHTTIKRLESTKQIGTKRSGNQKPN